MFQGVQIYGFRANADWANCFGRDIAQGFQDLGFPALFSNVDLDGWDASNEFCRSRRVFFIDINGKSEIEGAWKFALIVDHPLAHAHLGKANSQTLLGTIDASHAQIRGYSKAPAIFVPHGGPQQLAEPSAERDIDVTFIGNIVNAHQPANVFEELALEAGRKVAYAAQDPAISLMAALDANGTPLSRFSASDFAYLLGLASNEAQRLARIAAVTSIRGCDFLMIGDVPNDVRERMDPNVTFWGGVNAFSGLCQLMQRSKIVLNISQKFAHGSHERIWYGMACGAAIITNRSTFVEQSFSHDENILYYDHPAQVGDLVQHAIQGGTARRLAEAALPIYLQGHTWRERASRILPAMNALALRAG